MRCSNYTLPKVASRRANALPHLMGLWDRAEAIPKPWRSTVYLFRRRLRDIKGLQDSVLFSIESSSLFRIFYSYPVDRPLS